MKDKNESCINGVYYESINEELNITSTCMCFDNGRVYRNDLTLFRIRDCNLPLIVIEVFYYLLLIWSLLAFIYVARKVSSSVSLARSILISQLFWAFLHILFSTIQIIYRFSMNGITIFLMGVIIWCIMAANYAVSYSFASPLYKMAEKSDLFVKRFFTLSWFVFGVLRIAVSIHAAILYNDFNDESNDQGWNLDICIFMLLTVAEVQVALFGLCFFGLRVVSAIEALIEKTPDNPNHVITKQYVKKARRYIKGFLPLGLPVNLGYGVVPIIYLTTGSGSYAYISLMVIFGCHPQGLAAVVALATREKTSKEASVNDEQEANQRHNNANQIGSVINLATTYNNASGPKSSSSGNSLSKYQSDL